MLKRLRFNYLLFRTYFRKNLKEVFRIAVFVLFIVVFLRLTFFSFWMPLGEKIYLSVSRTTYTEGMVGMVKSLNPLFETTEPEKEINHLIFRGLMKTSPNGEIIPDLAENYQIVDNTTYIFRLRQDVYWQDGEKFSADDVVYTIKQIQNPNLATTARTSFKDVGIEKVDDYTVKFTLKETFAPFLSQTTVGIVPKHISLRSYRPVGTGDFSVVSFSPDKIVLNHKQINLVFKLYSSEEKAVLALKQGEIKALGGLNPTQEKEFSGWTNLKMISKGLPSRIMTIFFNTKADFVSDKTVRQALAAGLDKKTLLGFAEQGSKLAAGPFQDPNFLGVEQNERFPFDKNKASSLLDTSGWKLVDGKRVKDNKKLTISLTISKETVFENLANSICNNWKDLGIEFQVIELNGEDFKTALKQTQFQAILTTEEVSTDPDQYVLWHSTQIRQGNITSISSPKLDKLLEDGRKSNDRDVRKDKYSEFARILADESPAIFLYYPGYAWVVNSRISNIKTDYFLTPADRFQDATDWKIPKLSI